MLSDVIIIILEMNIPWPAPIRHDKILVPGRSFIACIRRQHTLDTNTDALDRLHGRPARRTKQVQTDNPVAVDVRVDGDRARGFGGCCGWQVDKLDFGGFFFISLGLVHVWIYLFSRDGDRRHTDRILRCKRKLQPVGLVLIQRVLIENPEVHLPFFQAVASFGDGDSRWEMALHLEQLDQCHDWCYG